LGYAITRLVDRNKVRTVFEQWNGVTGKPWETSCVGNPWYNLSTYVSPISDDNVEGIRVGGSVKLTLLGTSMTIDAKEQEVNGD